MWTLLKAWKARTVTTALVVAATLMLSLWSAGQSATFAGAPFTNGPAQQQILPGGGSLQPAGGGREFSARQRMDAFRLGGHTQNAADNDPPFDASRHNLSAPITKAPLARVSAPSALAPSAHAFPFDPRGPPAV